MAMMTAVEPLEALLRGPSPTRASSPSRIAPGGGDHFQVTRRRAERFDGLSLVEQHRLVYDALAEPLADGSIHELRIKTRAPHHPEGGTTA